MPSGAGVGAAPRAPTTCVHCWQPKAIQPTCRGVDFRGAGLRTSSGQPQQALPLLLQAKQYEQALALIEQHDLQLSAELAEELTQGNGELAGGGVGGSATAAVLERIAQVGGGGWVLASAVASSGCCAFPATTLARYEGLGLWLWLIKGVLRASCLMCLRRQPDQLALSLH